MVVPFGGPLSGPFDGPFGGPLGGPLPYIKTADLFGHHSRIKIQTRTLPRKREKRICSPRSKDKDIQN